MKNTVTRLVKYGKTLSLALMLIATCSPAALAVSDKPWTAIGSDGTVDEGEVTFTGNIAYLKSDDGAVIRYNVVAVDGLVDGGPALDFPRMTVRFRDNGNNNHIVVHLKRVDISGGGTTQLLTLDSNSYPGSSSFQTRYVDACGDDLFAFDFANYAYFVEVTMTRTGLPITPGVAAITLDLNGVCIATEFLP
jgi:hypothetical protein